MQTRVVFASILIVAGSGCTRLSVQEPVAYAPNQYVIYGAASSRDIARAKTDMLRKAGALCGKSNKQVQELPQPPQKLRKGQLEFRFTCV